MAKIPTYQSKRTPSGKVARPNLPDFSVNIAQKLVSASNKVLDAKAIDEGYKAGKTEQAEALSNGNTYIEKEGYTLRNEAYNKGANAAYVAGMKSQAEEGLNQLAIEINDPLSTVAIDERVNTYTEKKNALRDEYMANIPSHLQADLTGYFDALDTRYGGQVFNNQRNLQVNEIKTTIAGRVDNALDNFPALIRDGGYIDNELLETQFSDLVAAIDEGLGTVSPATAQAYKSKLKTIMQSSAIRSAYENAPDKEAFIEDLEAGGPGYKSIMQDINSSYFDGDEDVELSLGGENGYKTLAKKFRIDLKNDKADMAVDRAIWEQDATTALNLFKSGVNPDYEFDAQAMKELGFSDTQILKYGQSFEIAEAIYPELIEARSTAPNDNTTLLKTLQSEFYALQNKENLTKEDRQDLVILSAQIDGIGTIVANQQKYIADGDINLLFDQAGVTYDTSTAEGIQAFHNKAISQFGLDENLMKVVPQAQLDQDMEIMTTGSWNDVVGLSQKYGKYFEKFVSDAGLTQDGYQTVAVFTQTNPKYAEQMFNAINDMEANIKSAKKINSDFAGADGDLAVFTEAFEGEYKEFLLGNQDMANDITNAAQALWIQTYLRTGDEAKATNSIIKNFDKNFTKFDYNGMRVLLPAHVDSDAIRTKVDDFAKHPQKYAIHTGSNFDINDFKEDFEDNTYDNYSLAIDGGTVKVINKENAMGVVTIFKKLPSASGEMTYTNTITLDDNMTENVESLETKDVVDVWEFDSTITEEVVASEGDVDVTEEVSSKFSEKVKQKVITDETTNQLQVEAYNKQEQEMESKLGTSLYEQYKQFDKNQDGNIMGEELNEVRNYIDENTLEAPELYSNFDAIETMMFEYAKLKNKPIDEYVGTISKDSAAHDHLQAISMFIKEGEMAEFVIEYLSDLESFEALANDEIATEVMLNWKDNMNRTTNTKPPTRMTPIQSLYDYVRDLEESIKPSQAEVSFEAEKQVLMMMSGMTEQEAEDYINKKNSE